MLALAILSALLTQSPGQIAKGANLPPLKVHVIKEDSSEEKDLTKDRPERKTVYLFLPGDRFDRPAARFLRSLDQDLVKKKEFTDIVVVWQAKELEPAQKRLPLIQKSLQLGQTTWSAFVAENPNPEGWAINPDDIATLVIADGAKVMFSKGYKVLNEKDLEPVLKVLGK